jgi:hypothetical protein
MPEVNERFKHFMNKLEEEDTDKESERSGKELDSDDEVSSACRVSTPKPPPPEKIKMRYM